MPALAQEVYIGILDAFDAKALTLASMHKLMAAQTGAQVRRTIGDPLTQDAVIPFTASGAFDETALSAHAGNGNAFFVSALDPAGRGFPAEQLTATAQPRVVSAGVIERDGGPLPSMIFSGGQSLHSVLRPDRTAYPNITVIAVYRGTNTTTNNALWGADGGSFGRLQVLHWNAGAPPFGISTGSGGVAQPAMNTTNRLVYAASLRFGVANGSFVMVNGVSGTPFTESGNTTHNTLGIGALSGDNRFPMIGSIEAFAMIEGALTAVQLQIVHRNLGERNAVTVP
jgi:hypothetical protein